MKLKNIVKLRYYLFLGTLVLGLFSFMSLEEQTDYWYFYSGQEIHWKAQADVMVFRTRTHTQYAGIIDTSVVDVATFRDDNPDKLNIICFKATASASAIDAVKQEIRNDAGFEAEFPAITMVPNVAYSENLWYFANDLVMLTFKSDSVGQQNASRIASTYGLQQVNNPVGIAGGSYTYIYRFVPGTYSSGVDLVRNIYTGESNLLDGAEPNLVKVYLTQSNNNTTTSVPITTGDDRGLFYVVNDKENALQVYYRMNAKVGNLTLRVYDLFGRQLHTETMAAGDGQTHIDISTYSTGIYFASLEDSSGKLIITQKFKKM